jgi:hypothetical protein
MVVSGKLASTVPSHQHSNARTLTYPPRRRI